MIRTLLIIIGLTFILYANTLNNKFVSDDIPAIASNPDIGNISHIFSSHEFNNITSLINSLNYLIGKLNPFIYHLTNIAFHALNSVLVFFFLRLFFNPGISFLGSLIFVTHPIHTEAVAWISGRPYVIFTTFLLFSFLLYVRATSGEKIRIISLLGSMLAFCLGLSTNTFAVVYPGMTMLYDITFGKARKNYKLWLLFFLLAFLKLWLMRGLAEQRVVQVALDTGAAEFTNPLINVAHSIFSNLWLFIWPKNLTLYHEPLVVSQGGLRLELLALVAVILSLPFVFKKARVVFFALGLFILFLAPTYSPMMVGWLVAERYLYFPSIAFSLVIAFVAAKALKASRAQKFIITSALGILVVVYSLCTVIRNLDWKDHSSIWRATVKVSAQSPRAHNNMGDVYCLEGNLDKAAKEFTRAVELKPNYAETYHNLANTYQKMGKIDAAILNYQKAISINPQLWQSHQNLGVIYLDKGEPGLAKKHFQEALKMNPDNPGLKQVLKDLTSSTN